MTGADVELSFVGFEVLAVVIELHMAAGGCFIGFAVVFDVIGAKTAVPVVNIHVPVGGGQITFAALRFRFQACDSAFARRKPGLLGRGSVWCSGSNRE